MIKIDKKNDCCGCSACKNACPVGAIVLKSDNEGFKYPLVNKDICIACGKCDKVCPMKQTNMHSKKAVLGYAVQNRDSKTLYHSAAGGAFSAIANAVLEQKGAIYGAGYDENMVVKHFRADNENELIRFRSSKYVQSDISNIFASVKEDLQQKKTVCFSGTPCQVAGLKSFLGKEYENLITVDLVCKGVGSPRVLEQYVSLMEKKYNSKIVAMNFKRKTYGYHSSTMSVDFANGETYSRGGITDPMMRSFRANICLRPSCATCPFKGIDRVSDLTIFDCWHYTELTGKKDDDKGHTAVLVHSDAGEKWIHLSQRWLKIDPIDVDDVIGMDGVMVSMVVVEHPKRQQYFEYLSTKGINDAINSTIPISRLEMLKDRSKKILHSMGILSLVKKVFANRMIK